MNRIHFLDVRVLSKSNGSYAVGEFVVAADSEQPNMIHVCLSAVKTESRLPPKKSRVSEFDITCISSHIILWLQGGPGASDIFGIFALNGPYVVRKNLAVELRSHTWAKEFNVICVDNPVGTGFSFTNDDGGYSTNEDEVADKI
ncbi:unnamed protein product [Larinioides sclopetarius]|uniref:Uncharacterized protein n=1 Tax=Larinioides sclopetarius TaxID=280406 RepID=A0AAV1ZT86_9ARAC